MEITIRNPDTDAYEILSPRYHLASSGFAIKAKDADTVDGLHASDLGTGDGHSLDGAHGGPTDAVYVDDEGNVGIGTTEPDGKLVVSMEGEGCPLRLKFNGTDAVGMIAMHRNGERKVAHVLENNNNYSICLDTTDRRMTFLPNGNIGIGMTEPSEKLEVAGTIKATTFVGDGSGLTNISGTADSDWKENEGHVYRETGNVGIGTTEPTRLLDIGRIGLSGQIAFRRETDGGAYGAIGFDLNGNGGDERYLFEIHNGSGTGEIRINQRATNVPKGITFYTQNQFRAKIDPSGNVGIGTTSPAELLHINSSEATGTKLILEATDVESGRGGLIYGHVGANGLILDSYKAGGWVHIGGNFGGIGNANAITINTNDAERIRIDSSGNVGIGTTSPEERLHVKTNGLWAGVFEGNDSQYGAGITIRDDDTTYGWDLIHHPVGGYWGSNDLFAINKAGSGPYLVVKGSDGNIGIGTTNPDEKLDVVGTVKATAFVGDGSGLTGISVGDDSYGSSASSPNDAVYVDDSGNVGIGATSPSARLEVRKDEDAGTFFKLTNSNAGASAFTQQGFNNGTDYAGITLMGTGSGRLFLITNHAPNGFYLDQAAATGDFIFRTGTGFSEKLRITNAGNVGIGTTSPGHRLTIQSGGRGSEGGGILFTDSIGDGRVHIYTSGNADGASIIDMADHNDNTVLRFHSYGSSFFNGGNLGIGTTSPGEKLDVAGTAQMEGFKLPTGAANGYVLTSDTAGFGTWQAMASGSDTDWTEAGGNIYREAGNVGIGTTDPGAKLDISGRGSAVLSRILSGSTSVGNYPAFQLGRTTGDLTLAVACGAGEWVDGSAAGDVILRTESSSTKLHFGAGTTQTMTIGDGNVGIGTTEPGAKLDVIGDALISGNVGIGTTSPSERLDVAGTVKATSFVGDGSGLTGISGSDASYGSSASSPNDAMYVDDSGNIGIGTTSPDAGLQIAYSDVTRAALAASQNGSGDLVNFALNNNYGSQSKFIIKNTGNVGIGTTSPSYKLDVNGNIRCASLTQTSDIRLKEDIIPIDNALEKVTALRGVGFNWRVEEYPEKDLTEGRKIGLIAQEVEEVFPEVVSIDDEGYKAVEYGNLVGVLVEAIKVQQAQIEAQQGQIEAVKVENEKLMAINSTLKQEIEQIKAAIGL